MSELELDQMLHAAGRQAQQAVAASLDIERQLAAAKAAASADSSPVHVDPAGTPSAPERSPEDRYAVPVISLRLIACKLDQALKMARDLTRDLLPFYCHDLSALQDRPHHQNLGTFPFLRVRFSHSRAWHPSGSRARSAFLNLGFGIEFKPGTGYRTLNSVSNPAPEISSILDRGRSPSFDRALNRDRALALDLALDLARDLASEIDAAVALGGSLAHKLFGARDKILELEAVLFRALDLALAVDRARALALESGSRIAPVHEPEDDIDRSVAGVREGADALSVALDRSLSLNPISLLASIEVDVSGADLSHANIQDPAVLDGVTWTLETTWPPGIVHRVHSRSREIRPGVYQVCDGGDCDSVSPAIAYQPFSSSSESR